MEHSCKHSEYSKPMSLYQKYSMYQEMENSNKMDSHSQDSELSLTPQPKNALTDHHPRSRYCEHNHDRRSRLCNYIMGQHCPTCQLPMHSNDFYQDTFGDREPVKSRYMDFYYKNLQKQGKSAVYDYTYVYNPKTNYPASQSQIIMDDGENAHCQTMNPRPVVAKSRYMDYLKNENQHPDSRPDSLRKGPIKTSRLDWKDYHRLHTIHKFLDDMQYNHPSLCTTGVIGSSIENRDLKVLKVSNCKVGNTSVWIDAGIHAREWIAPAVNTYIANYIVQNFDNLPNSMTNKDWYFLPVMNPDGYEFSHTNYRMWRKNRAWIGNECTGVDLNRNFSHGWGGKGSSDEPKSPFYRGPHPFSEPESRAVRDMLQTYGINFQVYLTLHSFGEVILFPFAYRDELCPDYIRLLQGATAMSKAIYNTSGNTYKVGISRDVMYGAAGTSCDWSYGEAKIPYCYLIELRSKKHKFRLPQIEIEETGKEILSCVMALMEFVDKYEDDDQLIIIDSATSLLGE